MIGTATRQVTDPDRLAAVRRTALLGRAPDERFDRLARLAAQATGASVACITLIDASRQFWISAVGAPEPWASQRGVPLDYVWCSQNLQGAEPLLVQDGRTHPLVRSGAVKLLPGLLAYAGVPLRTTDGYTLGSVCVLDVEPRAWTEAEVAALRDIAALALAEIGRQAAAHHTSPAAPQTQRAGSGRRRRDSRFSAAFHNSPTAMSITRLRDGLFMDANTSFELLLGHSRAELLGQTAVELGIYPDPEGRAAIVRMIQSEGRIRNLELELRTRAGELRYVLVSGEPIEIDGETCILGTFLDITDRRHGERRLQESEERFRLLVEGAQEYALYMLDRDGHVATWNSGAQRIKGYAEAEIVGKHYRMFFTPADRARGWPEQLLSNAAAHGSALDDGWRMRRDGSLFWASVVITALKDRTGELRGFSKLTRDTTGPRQIEDTLRRTNRALALVTACNQLVARATDEAELLAAVCDSITTVGGYRMAWVGYAETEPTHSVRPVAYAGFEDGYLAGLEITWDDTPHGQGPTGRAIRTGQPAVSQDIVHNPTFAAWRTQALERGYASSIALPLRTEAETFGALCIYAAEPRAFDHAETALLADLAHDLAFGIVSLRTRAARVQAENRLAVLAETGQAFADAGADYERAVREVVHITAERLGDMCIVRLIADDSLALRAIALHDRDPHIAELLRVFDTTLPLQMDDATPTMTVVRTGQPHFAAQLDAAALEELLPPDQAAVVALIRPHSQIIAPMRVHGEPIGVLILNRHRVDLPPYTADDLSMAQNLADRTALVVSNARLLAQAQQELAERRRAEERLRFLTEVSMLLGESLDYEATLARVAQLSIPFLADTCNVSVMENGQVAAPTSAYADPLKGTALQELMRRYPVRMDGSNPLSVVVRSGQPLLVPALPLDKVLDMATDAEHRELLERAWSADTGLLVPMLLHGQVTGVIGFIRSADERPYTADDLLFAEEIARRAAVALQNARLYRDARQALDTRDRVLAVVTHDLRNPLAAVSGFSNILRRRILAPQADTPARLVDVVDKLDDSVRRMTAMLTDLADSARLQSGRMLDLELASVDLVQLVRGQIAQFQLVTDNHWLVLDTSSAELWGTYDQLRLERTVANLLGNAIKYSPHGGTIGVALRHEASTVVLTVKDTGIGIPEHDLARVFEHFQRASNVGAIQGTGIGLASARQIAEQHGGTLDVTSHVGIGTTFTLRLPYAPAHLDMPSLAGPPLMHTPGGAVDALAKID